MFSLSSGCDKGCFLNFKTAKTNFKSLAIIIFSNLMGRYTYFYRVLLLSYH